MGISEIIEQDVKAAFLSAQGDDFRLMNIYSNRIMMDAVFDKNPNFALIGFFLRQIAMICGHIKTGKDTTAYSTAKSIAVSYIKSVAVESKSEQLWSDYADFFDKIRKYEEDEYEKKSYKDNPAFTNASFNWLLRLINADRKLLFRPNNRLITGIANEMDRIIRVHGGGPREIHLISLFKALDLYSGYLDYFAEDYRNEIIQNCIFPYLDSITNATQKEKIDFDQITSLLAGIIFDWRVCYIQFLERPSIVQIEEHRVPITEETKKKLSESVEKALEKEVK
jgi:hypothetical protein